MKASVTVVIAKCEFRYIQLATSIDDARAARPRLHRGLDEQLERRCSMRDHVARVLERVGDAAVDRAAHQPVEPVRAAEQHDLPQQVGPALGEDAGGEAVGERPQRR